MAEIKILHLSDFHFDSSKPKDTQIILAALWQDLDNFKDIDFILFSGDLVKAGDKKDDFENAFQLFIKPLLKKTNLDEEKFFIVPGNHDIQKRKIRKVIELLDLEKSKIKLPGMEQKKVGKYITNYLILQLSLSVFKEYRATSKDAARRALRILERSRGESPDNPEIEYFLARLFYISDFYEEARKAISRFYTINKDDASPLIARIEEIQKAIDKAGNPGENPVYRTGESREKARKVKK